MFKPFYTLFALVYAVPSFAQNSDLTYNSDLVKTECTAEWDVDFAMIKYCMDQRSDGHRKFSAMVGNVSEIPAMVKALSNCRSEWGEQWDMVAYCGVQQIDGATKLVRNTEELPTSVAETILGACSQQWGVDFAMVSYCSKNQVDAWKSINN